MSAKICLALVAAVLLSVPEQALSESASYNQPMTVEMSIRGGKIQVVFDPGELTVSRPDVIEWVRRAAESVSRYYGRFPVSRTVVRVTPQVQGRIGFASTTYNDDLDYAFIAATLGRATTRDDLLESWTLTHEMVHLGFPIADDTHRWLAEGIATYVEPIARYRAGIIPASQVWGEMVRDMPQGLPQANDHGLDYTHSWGRTYWGGAIYCLLADIEIRRRTNNKAGLEDALRGIDRSGGSISSDYSAEEALDLGDRAVGTAVLKELYDKMKAQPVRIDLDRLWQQLGVSAADGEARFNDSAPLALVRKAIMGVQEAL